MKLQLLSLTLAFDDARFFGSIMFTDSTRLDEPPLVVLIDHADEAPWFRLSNVEPDGQVQSVPAMDEADRIMRLVLRDAPDRIGRSPTDFSRS